jgi:hypothetical protein
MRQEAEIWQTYRGVIQTKGRNPKPGKVEPEGPKWGLESHFEYFPEKLTHF